MDKEQILRLIRRSADDHPIDRAAVTSRSVPTIALTIVDLPAPLGPSRQAEGLPGRERERDAIDDQRIPRAEAFRGDPDLDHCSHEVRVSAVRVPLVCQECGKKLRSQVSAVAVRANGVFANHGEGVGG